MARQSRLLLYLVVLLIGLAPVAQAADFKVVVHASNSTTSISASDLSKYFLKKDVTWPDGRPVVAVDLEPDSPIRAEFTSVIHGKKISSIKSYWHRQIFAGKAIPPVEQGTEAEVLRFVASNPGAVGYVSSSFALGANVKELALKD